MAELIRMPRLVTKITKNTVFKFEYRVDLSLDERNVLKRVEAFGHKLGDGAQGMTVSDLVNGQAMEFSTITGVLDHERQIKAAVGALRDMMESLRALGAVRSIVF
jgi:hypothetical protein